MIDPEPWLARPHPGPRATPLPLSPEAREAVAARIRPATAEKRIVLRGAALLAMADGLSIVDTSKALHVNARTVRRWRRRFKDAEDVALALADAPRSGRPPSLSPTRMRRASKLTPASRPATSGSR
ncbi:MAG TPA: helix-turn-helix domain-containing protein [Thermoanaerobaculia bacterium]|jgi:DNA-directed RNA polymerase specialized sigma24 family protein|nr:helix-turn-helix domain-containing protein [Thermoanaerobaculia bacterium]